jgi:hypothetical protein
VKTDTRVPRDAGSLQKTKAMVATTPGSSGGNSAFEVRAEVSKR